MLMADMDPATTLRISRDALARKRERNPGWSSPCLCADGGDWRRVHVIGDRYRSRCRACGNVAVEYPLARVKSPARLLGQ